MWERLEGRRDSTTLYVIPRKLYARQAELASDIPRVLIVDWRVKFLSGVTPTQRNLSLSVQSELYRLKALSEECTGFLCLINTEYLLSRFGQDARESFWRGLMSNFPYNPCVIVFTVLDSPELLPSSAILRQLQESGRLIRPERAAQMERTS